MAIFTRAYNDLEFNLTADYAPGSGTLRLDSLAGLPTGVPSSANPIRLSIDRQRDGAKTILIAEGRVGLMLVGCVAAEGKVDIPLYAGDVAKVRVSGGYINDLQDAHNDLEAVVAGIQAGAANPTFAAVNQDSVALAAGAPAASAPAGNGYVAASAADNSRAAVGLVLSSTAPGSVATVAVVGPATLADWTAVTGSTTLLPRATYFLGVAGGTLSAAPPAAVGQVVQVVGEAVSPTTLNVAPSNPILL